MNADKTYEMDLILDIAKRADAMFGQLNRPIIYWAMDVENVHTNGTPLRLHELLAADKVNFAHDLGGIYQHLNRKTKQLENCFLPRFAIQ